jgi:hypothetical protein
VGNIPPVGGFAGRGTVDSRTPAAKAYCDWSSSPSQSRAWGDRRFSSVLREKISVFRERFPGEGRRPVTKRGSPRGKLDGDDDKGCDGDC